MAIGLEGQRLEVRAGRVEIFVLAAAGVDPVEATDDEVIDHVDHRLGDAVVQRFKCIHPFLNQHFVDFEAFFHHRHFVALFAVQVAHIVDVFHRHNAHAVSAGIGFDDDERLVRNVVLLIFFFDLFQNFFDVGRQTILALLVGEIDLAAAREIRVDEPRIDIDQVGELASDTIVSGEMLRLAPRGPARV